MHRHLNVLSVIILLTAFNRPAVADEEWIWNVTEVPPTMDDPRIIDVSNIEPKVIRARTVHCGGFIRKITLADDEDALITMSGKESLRYPLHVSGGRNVRIVGLQFELETQPGCAVGELPNRPIEKHPNANIHPRLPGGMALRLQQWGTSFVEGLNIDVTGHQADCIVSRNPDGLSNIDAQRQRDVIIQNTYCSGVEGMGKSDIGDGVHGDLFQNQGNDVMRRLVFENVSHRTSQEGIVIHGGGKDNLKGTVSLVLRRYDYTWDPRFVGDDEYERFGLALVGKLGPDWTLEDVRIRDYRNNSDYITINDRRYGDTTKKRVRRHPEIKSGSPPGGAFAPQIHTGIGYTSPHEI